MTARRLAGYGSGVVLVVALGWPAAARQGEAWTVDALLPPAGDQASRDPVPIPGPEAHPAELLTLADEFRAVRRTLGGGVPDYAAIAAKQKQELPGFRQRLDALKTESWPIHDKVDYLLLRSEMNALDFQLRVWRPTTRNPSFYVNEAIDRVGNLLTGDRRFRGDAMPYTAERADAILQALADTGAVLAQASANLTEIVPELADIALNHPGGGYFTEGGQLEHINKHYETWAKRTAEFFPTAQAAKLGPAARKAADELLAFRTWLQQNRSKMNGKYAIGLDAVNWYGREVLLLPYTTDQLMLMSEMEHARSLAFMQLEMQKNRHLPKLEPAKTYEQYLAWDDETALILRRWYLEDQQILTDREDMPDVRSEEGEYFLPFGLLSFTREPKPNLVRVLLVPPNHWRAVYSNMGFRTDPGVLHGHEYWPGHTFEGLIHRNNPCPVRRSHRDEVHSQGWTFYNEELPVILDFPYVRGPRARELVYVNILQRAERISLSLKVLSGELTPAAAIKTMQANVPPLGAGLGIRPEEAFEEIEGILQRGLDHCQTGKLQIFKLLADRRMQLGDKFDLRHFHDQIMRMGSLPIALLRWEMTGLDDEVKQLWDPKPMRIKSEQ